LPLAIEYAPGDRSCVHCNTCDTFACAVRAKNDLATVLLPDLVRQGMELRADTVVNGFSVSRGLVREVSFQDRNTGAGGTVSARQVILAAGALGTPHLLLSAGLERFNPGGNVVGRYLMRHTNTIVFGIFPGRADPERRFHKQLAILDFYFGHPDHPALAGKIGSLQQVPTPPRGLVQNEVPGWPGRLLSQGVDLLTGLLAIAEDQPRFENSLSVDPRRTDAFGLPQPVIRHAYSERDLRAVGVLAAEAKSILRKAGAVATYVHPIRTFSHTVGTVRMGTDPATSALDPNGNFRGIDNLFVTDGSFMPTSAALNPSLTIAANALRIGTFLAGLA
jgi:choline dehydrogenase-like flavoprotein